MIVKLYSNDESEAEQQERVAMDVSYVCNEIYFLNLGLKSLVHKNLKLYAYMIIIHGGFVQQGSQM